MQTITIRKSLLYLTVILLCLPLCVSAQNYYMWNGAYDGTLTVKNNCLGISTEEPAAKLDILGGADHNGGNDPKAMSFQYRLGGYRHWIRTRHNADPNNPASNNAIDFFLNSSSAAKESSEPGTGNVHGMSVTAAGVGIGTKDPMAKLDILADGVNQKVMAFQFRSGGFRHWIRTRHSYNHPTLNAVDFFLNSSSTSTGSTAPGEGSVLGMSITAVGVGLGGVEEPAAKLDILGGADHNGGNDPKAMSFQYRLGGYRHWIRTRHNADPNNPATMNAIDFFLNSSSTAAGSRAPGDGSALGMSITAGGVGLGGIEEPTEKLDINGNIKIRGVADEKAENKPDIGRVLTCMDAKGTAKWVDMGSHGGGWVAQTRKRRSTGAFDESDAKIVTTDRLVGIGTVEPEEKLDINGNIKIRGTAKVAAPAEGILADIGFNAARSTLGLRIRGSLSPGTNWKSDITFSLIGDTDREAPYKYEFDYLKFSNATQNIIAYKPLLISKSGEGSTVEIGSELYQPAMAVDNALAFQIGRSDDNFNAGRLRFIYKGDKNTNNVLSLGFHSNNDILNVVATGKVGISTSAPLAKFDILGGSDNDGRNGAPMMAFQYRDGGYRHWIKTRHNGVANDNKNAIDFYLNNSTTKDASSAPDPNSGSVHGMSITATGVGIGTTTPDKKLHVVGGGIKVDNGDLHIRNEGSNGADILIGTSLSHAGWIGTTNNYGLYIGSNNNATNMYLDTDDNVFIGFNDDVPSVPNAMRKFDLFVHQGILTEDYALAPKSSWSDYVFDKEYQLKKLSEVENFIQKNKHLPNIPSKEEIAKEGYSLHEVNVKLLEKIEELTLYAIEQEKKIVEQEQDIKSLKTQVSHFSQQEERIKALEEKILNQSK